MSISDAERELIEIELRIEERTLQRHDSRIHDIDHDIEEMNFRRERELAYRDGCLVTINKLKAMLAGD